MKISYLGTGSWGFCLATLLAKKGHQVVAWTIDADLCAQLKQTRIHPIYPDFIAPESITFTTSLEEALKDSDMIVESVTTGGLRPVLTELKKYLTDRRPLVLTSKGIEIDSGLTLPDVVVDVLGSDYKRFVGMISGPSFAQEIIHGLPTSIVGTSFDFDLMNQICEVFTTETLRVYPNSDIEGIALAGALKNIIAICCGMADALNMGSSAKAALMTRGLHEIRKLAVAKGCRPETFSGLAGMGDLSMTCSSPLSRNFRFGQLIAQGRSVEQAQKEIGTIVEGYYSCQAALKLSQETEVQMPITEGLHKVLHNELKLEDAITYLMQRDVKEEHL
ncbi:MAG: Glycerol-3-phosphate dehydrogenase [NAD(P)+] [Chlamydiae bacterium]|nr:Glycerol-3-phosphate dehydrogenase [NAD(P)+] [Chlamydiota bacterium]